MECAVSVDDAVGDAVGIHPTLWTGNGALHHLSVLRKSSVQLFQRVYRAGDGLSDEQCSNLFQGQRTQISVSVLQEHPDTHQLRIDAVRVLRVLHTG